MSDDPSLRKAYDLKTPADSVRLYRDWADTYETGFVAEQGYELHLHVADAFVSEQGIGPVIDIGAGTGICGLALSQRGIAPLHATDISPEMLAQADQKGCYAVTIEGDILAGLPISSDTYQGAVSSGTFTHGHVGPDALEEVIRILKPGGLAVLSINAEHFDTQGFAAAFERLQPKLTDLQFEDVSIYHSTARGPHAKDIARLAIFRKAD